MIGSSRLVGFLYRLAAAAAVALVGWFAWGALQHNLAFVALNHLPSLFTMDADAASLATAEVRLIAALRRPGDQSSARRALALVQRAQGGPVVAPAGIGAGELLWWGRQKQKLGELTEAIYLVRWATDVVPELGDGWYYLGSLYEARAAWNPAREAYEQAVASPVWQTAGPSDALVALGDLYRLRWPGGRRLAARDSYRQALAVAEFSDPSLESAAHYGLGEYSRGEGDLAAAVPHYQAALALSPADHWARLRLGYALYWGAGDFAAAEHEIREAIDRWPGEQHLKWPYLYLGEIYESAGLTAEAIAAYEQVLALDAADARARGRLAALQRGESS